MRHRPFARMRISRTIGALTAVSVVSLLLLGACSRQTKLGASWKDPDYTKGRIRKVLVIGVAQNQERRSVFENGFVTAFRNRGIGAEASHQVIPGVEKLDKEIVSGAVVGKGFDAVIVTRLVGIDTSYERSPGGYYVVPDTYYNSLYGYYGQVYQVVQGPDEIDARTVVSLETNLYEIATEKLIWTVQSKAVKKESVFDSIRSFTETMIAKLSADGLV